jgi:hemerythrin-like metal-binding protein
MVNSIAAAVEEQSVNTQDIAGSTSQAAGNVSEVNTNISQMLEAARLITRDIAQVSNQSGQVYDTSSHVNAGAVELSSLSQKMQDLVSGFKIPQNLLKETSAKTESGAAQNLIEWSDNYSVHVQSIDRQHKRLVDLINKLHKAMRSNAAKTVIAQVIHELVDYTQVHFKDEEKLMEKAGYVDLDKQKVQHFKFVEEIAQFQEKFNSGKTMISMDVMKFLKDWLLNHIQNADKKYSADMHRAGIK